MIRGFIALAAALLLVAAAPAARAGEEQVLIDRAKVSVDAFAAQSDMADLRKMLATARGVIIFPEYIKASFLIGGEGGGGVLLARDPQGGQWSAPVFYLMGGGSFGLQAGGEISEIMLVIRTEKGLDAVLKNRFKVGADATVAFGTIGKGLAASTTSNVGADIVTFSRAKGLAAGISIDGAVLQPRDRWNDTYYAKPVTPREILAGNVDGMGSDALRQALKAAEAP